jgi:hypothetical protein
MRTWRAIVPAMCLRWSVCGSVVPVLGLVQLPAGLGDEAKLVVADGD